MHSNAAQLADLTAELQQRFGSTLEIRTEVDPDLIGGVKSRNR